MAPSRAPRPESNRDHPVPAAPTTTPPTVPFFEALAVGALSAGVNLPTFLAVNAALFFLVATLVALLALSHRSRPELVPHLLALVALTTGLWSLLVWLVTTVGFADARKQRSELFGGEEEAEEEEEEEEEAGAAAAGGGGLLAAPAERQQEQEQRQEGAPAQRRRKSAARRRDA
jgi:hypothetical protein